jgi:DNA-binding IclR family transcriptional regulator
MNHTLNLTPTARLIIVALRSSSTALTYRDLTDITGASLWTLQELMPELVRCQLVRRDKRERRSFFTISVDQRPAVQQ